ETVHFDGTPPVIVTIPFDFAVLSYSELPMGNLASAISQTNIAGWNGNPMFPLNAAQPFTGNQSAVNGTSSTGLSTSGLSGPMGGKSAVFSFSGCSFISGLGTVNNEQFTLEKNSMGTWAPLTDQLENTGPGQGQLRNISACCVVRHNFRDSS